MSHEEDSTCVLQTSDGPVRGRIDRSDQNKPIYTFKGIPYANPPLGHLRFLAPTPFKTWTEIRDCTNDTPWPYSIDIKTKEINGSEDCLYLEVFTPSIDGSKRLPVMFWIGCFAFACNIDRIFDPTLLVQQDVIYVRCGFRLGPFGFLSINDVTAPGNVGLKDIVMALKWVQRNISAFGGDPNNVTIFGNSAGGALVHLMLLSPMAAGLFHKAIIQSASALNNWALDKNPFHTVMEFAQIIGLKKTTKTEMVDELRSIPAEDIMEAFRKMIYQRRLLERRDLFDTIFKPCVEVEFEGQPAFLTKSPPSLLKSGKYIKVPLIIGSNNIEAAILNYVKKDFYDSSFEKYNQNTHLLVPNSLAADPKTSKAIGQELLKFYLGGEEQLRVDTEAQYLQLVSDYYFLYYVNKTLRLHCQHATCPVYYYILNYAGEWSVPEELVLFNSMGHSAELSFLYRLTLPQRPPCAGSRDSITTRARMVKMWTNFAKHGNPTPYEDEPLLQITWDAVHSPSKLNYLSIGSELTKGTNPFQERMAFWDRLHKDHMFLRALVYFNDLGVSKFQ